MSKWQNMTTAPKDDSNCKSILGGWFDHGFQVDECYWDGEKWLCVNRTDGGYPDFWMPWSEPNVESRK